MGYVRVGVVIVSVIMTAASGPLLRVVSYRYVFPFAALFGIASSLAFGRIKAVQRTGEKGTPLGQFIRDSIMILRNNPGYRWFCVAIFISGSANLLSLPLYAIYQVDVLHVDTVWASWYAIVTQLVAMFAYVYWGHYIDRKSASEAVAITSLVFSVVPLIYCFATHAWMLLPVCVITGIISAGTELGYFSGVLHYAPVDRVASYQAVFLSLMGLRGIVAPFIGSVLVESNIMSMKWVFVISAALMLSSVVVQMIGCRKYP